MPEIKIDADICKKDGLCAMACTRAVFRQEEKGAIPEIDGLERCFGCGQCVSICPQDAISHSEFPKGTITPIRPEYVPSYDQVLELYRNFFPKAFIYDTSTSKSSLINVWTGEMQSNEVIVKIK